MRRTSGWGIFGHVYLGNKLINFDFNIFLFKDQPVITGILHLPSQLLNKSKFGLVILKLFLVFNIYGLYKLLFLYSLINLHSVSLIQINLNLATYNRRCAEIIV